VLHLIEVSLMLCKKKSYDSPPFMFLISLLIVLAATNKRICYLNISPDEVIRSLFYNKNNESLITVSVYESDRFSSLKCRTTPIE
jgi:hypothetical protein